MTGAKRILPPRYVLLSVIVMVALHFLSPIRRVIPSPWRFFGAVPLAAGVAAILWMAALFDRAGTTIRPFEESSTLVVGGLYRFSRNPIYLGMVCALLGVAILLGSVTPFLVVPAFVLLIDRRFIRAEEAMLQEKFGPGYSAFKASVRRWL
jgi:protein-S-isoprenylcysteine O-methyltransferase Ste14